jgi:hypothetical protein
LAQLSSGFCGVESQTPRSVGDDVSFARTLRVRISNSPKSFTRNLLDGLQGLQFHTQSFRFISQIFKEVSEDVGNSFSQCTILRSCLDTGYFLSIYFPCFDPALISSSFLFYIHFWPDRIEVHFTLYRYPIVSAMDLLRHSAFLSTVQIRSPISNGFAHLLIFFESLLRRRRTPLRGILPPSSFSSRSFTYSPAHDQLLSESQ